MTGHTEYLATRVEPEAAEALAALAAGNGRSIAAELRRALDSHLEDARRALASGNGAQTDERPPARAGDVDARTEQAP